MIKPTVGRVVWVREKGASADAQPLAGIIAHVNKDETVNVGVISIFGNMHGYQDLRLIQEGDKPAEPWENYCEWMPYQLGQAAKNEAERKVDNQEQQQNGGAQ